MATLSEDEAEKVKAYAAATDNVGLFFGEDIFFAIGSIVLIQQILATYGYNLAPLELALWAIPTAIAAFSSTRDRRPDSLLRPQGWRRARANDHAPLALRARRGDVRRLRAAVGARPRQPQALRQCRLLGADGAEPARRRLRSAISATACSCSASPGSPGFGFIGRSHPPTTSEAERQAWSDRLGNKLFLPALIIPVDRAGRHARL